MRLSHLLPLSISFVSLYLAEVCAFEDDYFTYASNSRLVELYGKEAGVRR